MTIGTKLSSLKECIGFACDETFPMFGVEDYRLICELPESSLNSGEEVNVLTGVTQGFNGSIVLGMPQKAACKLAGKMMGGREITTLDSMAKSAVCELTNMLVAKIANHAGSQMQIVVDISPPTLITGEDMFMMISRTPSKKVFFKLGDTKFNIAYALE
jgi:chemotaxis protein CheX